jgi:hypothetical protein
MSDIELVKFPQNATAPPVLASILRDIIILYLKKELLSVSTRSAIDSMQLEIQTIDSKSIACEAAFYPQVVKDIFVAHPWLQMINNSRGRVIC